MVCLHRTVTAALGENRGGTDPGRSEVDKLPGTHCVESSRREALREGERESPIHVINLPAMRPGLSPHTLLVSPSRIVTVGHNLSE